MIELKFNELEKNLGKVLRNDITVVGIDTASRTGWSRITVKGNTVKIDYGFIDIQSKDLYFKYNQMIETFPNLVKNSQRIVIEDVYMGFNPRTHAMLARIGMIVYVLARQHKVEHLEFIGPSSARKRLGIKGNCKKPEISIWMKDTLKISVDDNDITDAIVLGLNGLLMEGE